MAAKSSNRSRSGGSSSSSRSRGSSSRSTSSRSGSSRSTSSRSGSSRSGASRGGAASTASDTQRTAERNVEAAAERIRDLNERIIESGKKAGNVYLDIYEKTLGTIADYQEKVADQSQID